MSQSEPRRIVRTNVLEERYRYFQERGVLFLEEDIDDVSSSVFNIELLHMHKTLSDRMKFWITLKSPGGFVHHGLGIYDSIKMVTETGREVNVLGCGLVASMATVILQAGTKRCSLPNTQFLLHQVSETILFKREEVSEGEERIEEAKRINDVVMGIISTRSGISIEELKKRCRKTDYWLSPEGARKLGDNGLIDEIVTKLPF